MKIELIEKKRIPGGCERPLKSQVAANEIPIISNILYLWNLLETLIIPFNVRSIRSTRVCRRAMVLSFGSTRSSSVVTSWMEKWGMHIRLWDPLDAIQ